MSIDWGFNFRNTPGYVTDGTNEVAVLVEAYPHTYTIGGGSAVGGWNAGIGGARDRDNSLDRRLAGINFDNTAGHYFEVDLPATGDYDIHLAAGDGTSGNACAWDLYDGATKFASTTGTTAAAHFHDASDVDRTAAAWPGSEVKITRTFTSTTFKLMVPSGLGGNTTIAHLRIATSSGGGSVIPQAYYPLLLGGIGGPF